MGGGTGSGPQDEPQLRRRRQLGRLPGVSTSRRGVGVREMDELAATAGSMVRDLERSAREPGRVALAGAPREPARTGVRRAAPACAGSGAEPALGGSRAR